MLANPIWSTIRPVARLFSDPDTLRFFMSPACATPEVTDALDDDVIEQLAQKFHEDYRDVQIIKPGNVHPAVLPWEKLPDVYRSSSLARARALSEILASQGFAIVPESDPREAVQLWAVDEAEPSKRVVNPEYAQQLERMARLEHARWNAERLSLGWTLGPARDLHAKTSPYLVPFDDLPDEIKQYDYEPFLSLPDSVNAIDPEWGGGWKVVRIRSR